MHHSFFLSTLQAAVTAAIMCLPFSVAQDTCITDDGMEYQRGESMGSSFPTRCQQSENFPCFCNPDLPFQADCPYCTFGTQEDVLYCSKHQETISFPHGSITRICSCIVPEDPTENVIRNCEIAPTDTTPQSGTCDLIDLEGNEVAFADGESLGDLIPGVCEPASEFPTYCRVLGENAFDFQYPYCVFNDGAGPSTVCAKHNATIIYTDTNGDEISCDCFFNFESNEAEPDCKRISTNPGPPTRPPSVDKTVEPGEPTMIEGTSAPVVPTVAQPVAAPVTVATSSANSKELGVAYFAMAAFLIMKMLN